jgi:iron-sulfur cluster protein
MDKAVSCSSREPGNFNWLQKARHIQAMRKAFNVVRKRQRANISRVPDLEVRKKRLRQVREKAIGNEALLKQAVENLEQNGIKVYRAANREEAISLVISEIGNDGLVVKSKSNLTKEIGLTEALEAAGIDVVETDIGDRIIQLCGDMPSHPTGPASHLTSHDVARVLSAHLGKTVKPTARAVVELIRDEISEYISKAKIGITGANAIAAEDGAILLLHNEGNIIQVAMRPEKHIVLAGIDKIYPSIEEALNMLKLQTFYATGALSASFINVIAGSSQTADIEKQLIKGVHGPKEICLILVDNRRSDIARSDYKELLYCIGCGQCLLVCPAYNVYAGRFGVDSQLGGRGLVYSVLSLEAYARANDGLELCLTCRKCQQHCPLALGIPAMVNKLRLEKRTRLLEPRLQTAYDFVIAHIEWVSSAVKLEVLLLTARLLRLSSSD